MKPGLFHRKQAAVAASRIEAGEISIRVIPGSNQVGVAVAGRVTVDTSPLLRSALLGLIRRCSAPVMVIDASAVCYLDMSGIATLLEALKAAREHSVSLRLAGVSGRVRTLAEIVQLEKVFSAWGSEVEFC